MIHPQPVKSLMLPLVVLILSAVFEAYPWWVAGSEARKLKKGEGLGSFVDMAVRSKNPTVMVVLFEDTAALLGLIVAAIGISLAYYTQMPFFDAITSIVIGLILLAVALFLARETKELLIGESATKEHRDRMRQVILSVPEVQECGRVVIMHMGPDDILVNIDVEFIDGLSTDEVETVVDKIESSLKRAVPAVTKIYIEAEAIKKRLVTPKT